METPLILIQLKEKYAGDENLIVELFLYEPTGSAYTCDPPVTDTDEDWIVWAEETAEVSEALEADGWVTGQDAEEYDHVSFRKGRVNIILMHDMDFYYNWSKSTRICKQLNLLKKEDRKFVHRVICGEDV